MFNISFNDYITICRIKTEMSASRKRRNDPATALRPTNF